MQKKKTGDIRAFRPWPENEKRLDWAIKAGLNASELINQVLANHLKSHLEESAKTKAEEIRKTLTSPVP